MSTSQTGFFVLPFGIDGEAVGSGFWEYAAFTGDLWNKCNDCLTKQGAAFETAWEGERGPIRMKVTLSSGAGVLTLLVNDKIVSSCLLLSGTNLRSEQTLVQMFIESLQKSLPVSRSGSPMTTFNRIHAVDDRPLMVVVPIPASTVSENDHARSRQIGLHFGAAFFANQIRREVNSLED
jgi:hypothetical protein